MSRKPPGGRERRRSDALSSLPETAEAAIERAARLRQKAEELRVVAESMTDRSARMSLLCLAEDYEKLSDYASHRADLARRFRSRMSG
ncbi:MAG TPA: hypothetical protein VL966_02365 [Alphaproteobacteria bacterium]|jgi:hypothetical protein|nr:hypothetical protein [Alphaproteobacteria bacterium]